MNRYYLKEKKRRDDGKIKSIDSRTANNKFTEGTTGKSGTKSGSALKRLTLGGLMLFLFVLLYVPSLVNWLNGGSIARDILRIGLIEDSKNTNAVIIREEEILKSPELGGRFTAQIGEGEKTPAYSCVATVYNEASDSLIKELEIIDDKITKAHTEKAEKAEFFSEDLKKLDDEIGYHVVNMISACNSRNFFDISKYRSEIDKITVKKAEIVGESLTDDYIKSLKQQKESVQEKLNKNTEKVMSHSSGIVSYTIDGYEDVLNPKNIGDLTPGKLEHIIDEYPAARSSNKKAEAGKPLAKIIKGVDVYIAAILPLEYTKRFKEGDNIKLRVNGAVLETWGYIEMIGDPWNERAMIIVRTTRGANILSDTRIINVDFIIKTEEGLKVPLRCLRGISADGRSARIMLVKYNVAASRIVDIICKDEEYAIIQTPENDYKKTVNLYDTYIINPDNIREGDVIEK